MGLTELCTQQDADRLFLFNEASGASADAMGGASITWIGTPTYNQAGPLSGAFRSMALDGSTDYGNAGTAFTCGDSGATICCWVKSSDTTNRMDLLGSVGVDVDLYISLNRDESGTPAAGHIRVGIGRGANLRQVYVNEDTGITDGSWHFLAVKFSRTGQPVIYLDGTTLTATTISGSTFTAITALDWDLYIGSLNNAGSELGNKLTGEISNLAIFPWRIADAVLSEMQLAAADVLTASPTVAKPYEVLQTATTANSCTRFAVNVTGGRRMGMGVSFASVDAGGVVNMGDGTTTTAKTLSVTNLANRAGDYAENGTVFSVASGTQTLRWEGVSGQSLLGFIVRAPDSDSGTVIEAGSAIHSAPQAALVEGKSTFVGSQLYDGERWAWNTSGQKAKIFDAINDDAEERYHNGVAVIAINGNLFFAQVGHNRAYIRVASCTGTDLTTLSSVTQIGTANTELSYPRLALRSDGKVVVCCRDTQSTDALGVWTISDPLGTPTLDSVDYIVSGGGFYPRGLTTIGNDVFVLAQRRNTGEPWKGWVAARYVNSETKWYSLNAANSSGTSVGTIASPRFGTTSDIEILADPTGGGIQKYLGEDCAFWDAGSNKTHMAAAFFNTATADALTYAATTGYLAGYNGTTGTLTETEIPGVRANSYRQSGSVVKSGNDAVLWCTERTAYTSTDAHDEDSLYYAGWGGRSLRGFNVTSPWSASPVFTPVETAPTPLGELVGAFGSVDGGTNGELVFQHFHEGLSVTRMQAQLGLSGAEPTASEWESMRLAAQVTRGPTNAATATNIRRALLSRATNGQ